MSIFQCVPEPYIECNDIAVDIPFLEPAEECEEIVFDDCVEVRQQLQHLTAIKVSIWGLRQMCVQCVVNKINTFLKDLHLPCQIY